MIVPISYSGTVIPCQTDWSELISRTRNFEPTEVLTRLMYLFWETGYEATSLEDIVAASGLSRSSLYRTFGSKRQLFERILHRYLEGFAGSLAPLERSKGLDGIRAFFVQWRDGIRGEYDGSLGCLMVNTMVELGRSDADAGVLGDAYQQKLSNAFFSCLEYAAECGVVSTSAVQRRARLLTLLTLGLFVASRGKKTEEIAKLLNEAIAEVDSWRHPQR